MNILTVRTVIFSFFPLSNVIIVMYFKKRLLNTLNVGVKYVVEECGIHVSFSCVHIHHSCTQTVIIWVKDGLKHRPGNTSSPEPSESNSAYTLHTSVDGWRRACLTYWGRNPIGRRTFWLVVGGNGADGTDWPTMNFKSPPPMQSRWDPSTDVYSGGASARREATIPPWKRNPCCPELFIRSAWIKALWADVSSHVMKKPCGSASCLTSAHTLGQSLGASRECADELDLKRQSQH